jgi:three-Cys-motif partner protein
VIALRRRTEEHGPRAKVIEGDCNAVIDEIVKEIPVDGLNLALIDPFAASSLNFEATISKLASFKWMDLIIHWPTGSLKRNFDHSQDVLEEALGVDGDPALVFSPEDVVAKIGILRKQLEPHGYIIDQEVRTPSVTNSRHGILYHLVYVSKSKKGNSIWNSIVRREPSGQRNLF